MTILFSDTIIQRRRTLGTSKAAGKIEKFSLKGDLKTRSPYPRQIGENYFLLRPGVIPPGRQIFYQVLSANHSPILLFQKIFF